MGLLRKRGEKCVILCSGGALAPPPLATPLIWRLCLGKFVLFLLVCPPGSTRRIVHFVNALFIRKSFTTLKWKFTERRVRTFSGQIGFSEKIAHRLSKHRKPHDDNVIWCDFFVTLRTDNKKVRTTKKQTRKRKKIRKNKKERTTNKRLRQLQLTEFIGTPSQIQIS